MVNDLDFIVTQTKQQRQRQVVQHRKSGVGQGKQAIVLNMFTLFKYSVQFSLFSSS